MTMEFSETSRRGHTSQATIHGFRVQSYGKRLSPGFNRGLRRLAERDFDDLTFVVVRTTSGSRRSGITHAGGRYVHPDNPHGTEVMRDAIWGWSRRHLRSSLHRAYRRLASWF